MNYSATFLIALSLNGTDWLIIALIVLVGLCVLGAVVYAMCRGEKKSSEDPPSSPSRPQITAQCIASLNKKNKGIVLVRETIVREFMARQPGFTAEKAAANLAAQLGIMTCRGTASPHELAEAASLMVARARVEHLRSAAEALKGVPRDWDVPVYQVMFA